MTENFPERLKRLRALLDKEGFDGIYISSPVEDVTHRYSSNRRYLTGFTGSSGILLVGSNNAYLAVDGRYGEQAKAQISQSDFTLYETVGPKEQWFPEFLNLAGLDGKQIAISAKDVAVSEYIELQSIISNLKGIKPDLIPKFSIVETVRSVKDQGEVEKIKRAIVIAEEAFSFACSSIPFGVTESDFAESLKKAVIAFGGDDFSFEPIVASGPNAAMPHAPLSDRIFQIDDSVTVDWGVLKDGYCSDLTRSFILDSTSGRADKFHEVYDIVQAAQAVALNSIEVGMTGAQLHQFAALHIDEAGYGEYFTHGLGHGVGLDVHDYPPYLGPSSEDVLGEGMVFTIEPGIYIKGWGGVRIEDIVHIKDGRAQRLSNLASTISPNFGGL
tara:strand:+ start:2278 stop:3435 length:1158 start_codon:yes stop_codon:yes gene_type:complete